MKGDEIWEEEVSGTTHAQAPHHGKRHVCGQCGQGDVAGQCKTGM